MERINGLLVVIIFSLIGLNTYGQSPSTFIITQNGGLTDVSTYENALSSANLEYYRLADQRTTMTFTNGLEVELLSGKELAALGITNIDFESLSKNNPDALKKSVFELHSSGIILERKNLQDFRPKK